MADKKKEEPKKEVDAKAAMEAAKKNVQPTKDYKPGKAPWN